MLLAARGFFLGARLPARRVALPALAAALLWLLWWRRIQKQWRTHPNGDAGRVTFEPKPRAAGPPAVKQAVRSRPDAPTSSRARRSAQQCWRNAVLSLPSGKVRDTTTRC